MQGANVKNEQKTFMIFGSFSGANTGDTAVLYSLIGHLDAMFPESRFYVPTPVPAFFDDNECLRRYDIKPISMRRRHFAHGFFSPSLLYRILKCDAVFTTANMFFDRHLFSPWGNLIFSLLPVLLFYRIVKPNGKIIAASVSVTPPVSFLGKLILRKVLKLHDMVTLRDSNSELVTAKLSNKIRLIGRYPDLVIGNCYNGDSKSELPIIRRQGEKLIGINLSSYFAGELLSPGQEIMSGWINFFSSLISRLEKENENKVVFIMTQSVNEWMAGAVSRALGREIQLFGPSFNNFIELQQLISHLDVYLTMRMHGAIFAFSTGVPAVGLCFTRKMQHFYADYELGEFQVDFKPTDYKQERLLHHLVGIVKQCADLPKLEKEQLKAKMALYQTRHEELFRSIEIILK